MSFRESGFRPDIIAVCPAGTCQPIPVHAVGLFQIYSEAHPNYDYNSLKDPAYNVRAAREVYLAAGGWTPWNPLGGIPSLIPTVQAMVGSGRTELPSDVITGGPGPQDSPVFTQPADQPQAPEPQPVEPPQYIPPDIVAPTVEQPDEESGGFENIVHYFRRDLRHLHDIDAALIRELQRITGG